MWNLMKKIKNCVWAPRDHRNIYELDYTQPECDYCHEYAKVEMHWYKRGWAGKYCAYHAGRMLQECEGTPDLMIPLGAPEEMRK
jgi:hypothetical protein